VGRDTPFTPFPPCPLLPHFYSFFAFPLLSFVIRSIFFTFRVSLRRCEMYCGHARLCVCLCVCVSVRGRMPKLLHGPGCNLAEWYGMPPSCAQLRGFAIGARVALIWQHYGNAWQSPAVIRLARRTQCHALRMPAKTPLDSDKINAPAGCAVPFRPY